MIAIQESYEKIVAEGIVKIPVADKSLHQFIFAAVSSEKFDGLSILKKCIKVQIAKEEFEEIETGDDNATSMLSNTFDRNEL